jgi:ribosomal protein L20A (L18A)
MITGEIHKPQQFEPMSFKKEISADKKEHALEQIYTLMGSHHRAKRHQIRILKVEELEKVEDTREKKK